ncbi:MAG: hypothetical protein PHD13_06665 [Methanocellales archaeon]|nr:hypothetical protein [Methanocellales archaeon]MDD3291552.1 hypothetical protein [Methanocellales archaeon]MDD5235841.1 hypothetical protein [Methanocellales archaeon]MDD5485334.1 hypothetical protein [Methanocellales archaeon]
MYSRRSFIKSAFAAGALVTTGYVAFLKYFKEPPVPTPAPTPVPTSTPAPTPAETLESKINRDLLSYVPEIKNHDERVINAAVLQIRDDIYLNNLDTIEVKIGETTYNAWDYIKGAIGFVLPGLENVELNDKLKYYSDMDLRQILLPANLRTIDIKSILDGNRKIEYNLEGLGYGLKNVTSESPDKKSPQEVLGERVRNFYSDKESKDYEEAKYFSKGAAPGWKNSTAAFLEVRDSMFDNGEDAPLFVIGWSGYIVGEQNSSQFSSLVSRSMEVPLASYYSSADYPSGRTIHGNPLTHSEPLVSYKKRLTGVWMFKEPFLADYIGGLNEPNITLSTPYGLYDLLTLSTPDGFYNSFTFKPINPN